MNKMNFFSVSRKRPVRLRSPKDRSLHEFNFWNHRINIYFNDSNFNGIVALHSIALRFPNTPLAIANLVHLILTIKRPFQSKNTNHILISLISINSNFNPWIKKKITLMQTYSRMNHMAEILKVIKIFSCNLF